MGFVGKSVQADPEPVVLSIQPDDKTRVRFRLLDDVLPFRTFHTSLLDLIARAGASDVCDVGGGANPALSPAEIEDLGLRYTVLDISAEELEKVEPAYRKLRADVAGAEPPAEDAFDLVFSSMLAEHVRDGAAFHRNIFAMLRPNGLAFHFFPTLYALPFVLNRLAPDTLTRPLLALLYPKRDLDGHQVKFPAYYSWCRGPTPDQIQSLEAIGFQVTDYVGIFGHNSYYRNYGILLDLHRRVSAFLRRREVASQTSFAYVVLRKPSAERHGEPQPGAA